MVLEVEFLPPRKIIYNNIVKIRDLIIEDFEKRSQSDRISLIIEDKD